MRASACWRVAASGSRMHSPLVASRIMVRPSQSSRNSGPTCTMPGMFMARAMMAAWLWPLPSVVTTPRIMPEGTLNRSVGIRRSAARITGWSSASHMRGRLPRMLITRLVASRMSTLRSCM